MSDPDELALVVKAIESGLGGCVEWHYEVLERVRAEMSALGMSPEAIRTFVIAFVRNGGTVRQVKEQRAEWKDERNFYYKVILPLPGIFKNGLFVEMALANADSDYPEVWLVNVHEQK